MSKRIAMFLLLALATVACGTTTSTNGGSGRGQFTDADEACVEFYRAAASSLEEEPVYMRRFADRITELGYTDAGSILSSLADQWEVGVWEGEHDEVWQSAIWAEAGSLLGSAGAVRCADLAEWWGIDGYEGEPEPAEMQQRQAGIWDDIGLENYFLLVAGSEEGREGLTQVHVKVEGGEVTSVSEADPGLLSADDLPRSVDDVYALMEDQNVVQATYDLVWSVPRSVALADGQWLFVQLDTEIFPEPIVELDTPDSGIEGG